MIYRYIIEIQYRLVFSFVAWFSMVLTCYYFKETLLYLFIRSSINQEDNPLYFVTTNVTEMFTTYIQISYFLSNQIIILFFIWQTIVFMSEGLYAFEYFYLKKLLMGILGGWLLSFLLLNFIVFPISWEFFLNFQKLSFLDTHIFYFETKLNEYLTFYKSVFYFSNFICQTFILILILFYFVKTDLILIKKSRKSFYFFFTIVSTILTPPDVIFQLFSIFSFAIIYELLIILAIFRNKLILKR